MTKRRMGTRPHRTFWTAETVARIEAYQQQQQLPSFSATAETLVRLGLAQTRLEVITPIIASVVRHTLHQELERLIRLQLYTAVDAGMAQRFAAAAVRDVGRLKGDPPERYQQLKAAVRADTRRRLARDRIAEVIDDLYTALVRNADSATRAPTEDEDGNGTRELPDPRPDDGPGDHPGSPLLHDA